MSNFVKVGQRMVNLDYVSRVDPNPDGTATLYVDDSPPQTVPAADVPKLMEALQPPRLLPAQLLEAAPFVGGGLGGEGLPAGMFRTAPEPTPLAPVPEPPVPPLVKTPVPETPEPPVADSQASDTPAEPVSEASPESPAKPKRSTRAEE